VASGTVGGGRRITIGVDVWTADGEPSPTVAARSWGGALARLSLDGVGAGDRSAEETAEPGKGVAKDEAGEDGRTEADAEGSVEAILDGRAEVGREMEDGKAAPAEALSVGVSSPGVPLLRASSWRVRCLSLSSASAACFRASFRSRHAVIRNDASSTYSAHSATPSVDPAQ
jgi:hypothetical protein